MLFFHSRGSSAGWRCHSRGSSPPPAGETRHPVWKVRRFVTWGIISQPWASVSPLLKAVGRVLRLKFNTPFSASHLSSFYFSNTSGNLPLFLLPRKTSKCSLVAVVISENGDVLKHAESLKELLWGMNFATRSWKQTANVILCSTERQFFRWFKIKQYLFVCLFLLRVSAGARNCRELRIFLVFG